MNWMRSLIIFCVGLIVSLTARADMIGFELSDPIVGPEITNYGADPAVNILLFAGLTLFIIVIYLVRRHHRDEAHKNILNKIAGWSLFNVFFDLAVILVTFFGYTVFGPPTPPTNRSALYKYYLERKYQTGWRQLTHTIYNNHHALLLMLIPVCYLFYIKFAKMGIPKKYSLIEVTNNLLIATWIYYFIVMILTMTQ